MSHALSTGPFPRMKSKDIAVLTGVYFTVAVLLAMLITVAVFGAQVVSKISSLTQATSIAAMVAGAAAGVTEGVGNVVLKAKQLTASASAKSTPS